MTEGAGRRVQRHVRRLSHHPGHELDVLGVVHHQRRPGPLPLVELDVTDGAADLRLPPRLVHHGDGSGDQQRRHQDHHGRAAERDSQAHAEAADGQASGESCRREPPGVRGDHGRSSARGVDTVPSTAVTTLGPLAWVIHSSGLTVIRCDSTVRATAFTSSGIT